MASTTFSGPIVSSGGFTGDLTGNVTGNITGNVTGDLTGNVTGDVTGDLTGDVATSSLNVGAGGALAFIKKGQVTIDIASIAASAVVETSVTITGAAASDTVILNPPAALEADVCYVGCFVSAADTVKMRVFNPTGSPIDPASASWEYCIIR